MNLLTDPTNIGMWKTHFLNMARNKISGKGRRVTVKRDVDDKPIVRLVSPVEQTLQMIQSQIKGGAKRSASQSAKSSPRKRKKVAPKSTKPKKSSGKRPVRTRK